jgi:RNA polymerase sigma factor (sigma-70 family)
MSLLSQVRAVELRPPLVEPGPDEAALVRDAVAGTPRAFDAIVRLHSRRIYNFLHHLTRQHQDAEDLTQQTFVKAFHNLHRFDPQRPLINWLLTIARRSALNHFRAAKRWEAMPDEVASASRESAPPPTGLENRILRAVAESRIQRPRRRFPLPLAVGAAASAAVLLAAAMFLRTAPEPDHPGEEIAVLLQTADSLAERWWNSVVPGTATLVHENALQQELTSVVAGARSALDFLALNFLPVAPAPPPQPAGTI